MATDAQRFFDEYARAASGPDPQDLAAFHDDNVLHSRPGGVQMFPNDAAYRDWLAGGLEANAALGLQRLEPAAVGSYELAPGLLVATVQWRAHYARRDRPVEATVTYLLRRAPDGLRILCEAAHQDDAGPLQRPTRPAKARRKRQPRAAGSGQRAHREPSTPAPSQ